MLLGLAVCQALGMLSLTLVEPKRWLSLASPGHAGFDIGRTQEMIEFHTINSIDFYIKLILEELFLNK
jgi:hypothetical protein